MLVLAHSWHGSLFTGVWLSPQFESFCIAKYGHLENDDAFCSAMSRQWGEIPYVSSKVIAQLEKRIQESLLKKGGSERDVLSKAFRSLLVPDRT